ncbi:NAD-dependent epimerase/dehydratase family protein [Flavitalea antarctica]
MTQKKLVLVSGANGHLGNNLVRFLIDKGIPVRATVRNIRNKEPFAGLNCEVVQADNTDKASFVKAMEGVDTFYAVGAVFKLWAKDPQKEIYEPNMQGTRNVIEAAAKAGVRRIVYVSSIAALNMNHTPTKESLGNNPDRRDVYYNSKNDGELLAFQLAKKLGIELVAVLPSAMIGGTAFAPLSTSYNILKLVVSKKVPVDTKIEINWVDVKDVAEGCYLASINGRPGERYILSNEKSITLTEVTKMAAEAYPHLGLKIPASLPKPLLYGIAGAMQLGAKLTGKPPVLTVKDIAMFSGLKQNFDITKARTELGFKPKAPETVVREALDYLLQNKALMAV